jgi:hypothetical protein
VPLLLGSGLAVAVDCRCRQPRPLSRLPSAPVSFSHLLSASYLHLTPRLQLPLSFGVLGYVRDLSRRSKVILPSRSGESQISLILLRYPLCTTRPSFSFAIFPCVDSAAVSPRRSVQSKEIGFNQTTVSSATSRCGSFTLIMTDLQSCRTCTRESLAIP